MSGFTDFVSVELPKRPFTEGDGLPGQMLIRSSNPLAIRELVWADPLGGTDPGYTAAVAISGHQAITLDGEGKAILASADIPEHQYVEALTQSSATIGDNVQVIRNGIFEHAGWSFTVGEPVYLGLAGAITQTVPPEAVFSKVLGVVVAPTRIKVDFQPAIFF